MKTEDLDCRVSEPIRTRALLAAVALAAFSAGLGAAPVLAGGKACGAPNAVADGSGLSIVAADRLPSGWGRATRKGPPVDTYGNPIVNERPGLPGWAQRDVDDLRLAIANTYSSLRDLPEDLRGPTEDLLGNYLGQAIVRGIDVSDLIDVRRKASPRVGDEILGFLHAYENRRREFAPIDGYRYEPTEYSPDAVSLVEHLGGSLDEIRALDSASHQAPPDSESLLGGDTGCYDVSTQSLLMSALSGSTSIWNRTGEDNAEAVVPIGFNFVFYGCQKPAGNDEVLVSTNGYIVFHHATGDHDGTNPTNVSIPNLSSPNGFAAPSWDDYVIRGFLGTIDRVSYKTVGEVGDRFFIVEWRSVGHVGGEFLSNHSFQIALSERTGTIEFLYGTWNADEAVDSATVGLEQGGGRAGDCTDCGSTNGTPSANLIWTPATRPSGDTGLRCVDLEGLVGSNFDATGSASTECGDVDNHDLRFLFQSPGGTFTFSTCSDTALDTTLAILPDESGAEPFACSNNTCGPSGAQSKFTVDLDADTDYVIRLAGDQGAQGEFSLQVTAHDPPVGDSCPQAISLGDAVEIESTQSTFRNTGCGTSPCRCGDVFDQWFQWTAPSSGNVVVTTCDEGTDFDTTLHVRVSSCQGPSPGHNDDTSSCPFPIASKLSWQAIAGKTYFIRVAGAGEQRGNYRLHLRLSELFSDGFEWGSTVAWSQTVF